uniref:Uncharacterized protein n=1 Tax=Anguilla anguilla TaxID=7936 RepID=A0A0E9XQU3_ANGAN
MACPHLCNVICCPPCLYICICGCSCVSLAPTHACRIESVRDN